MRSRLVPGKFYDRLLFQHPDFATGREQRRALRRCFGKAEDEVVSWCTLFDRDDKTRKAMFLLLHFYGQATNPKEEQHDRASKSFVMHYIIIYD